MYSNNKNQSVYVYDICILEVPASYENKFNSSWYFKQREVAGMSNFWDEVIYNLTSLLKSNGMWSNTLIIITSDNGGPSGTDGDAANNSPLRGGKYSDFEGGIRVNSIVTGIQIYIHYHISYMPHTTLEYIYVYIFKLL